MAYYFFLTGQHKRGLLYKALQNVISALSNRIPYSVRHYHMIKKFMKGIFAFCPPKNKYHSIWNVDKLLRYLQSNRNWKEDRHKQKASHINDIVVRDSC